MDIRSNTKLPSVREEITLHTRDGLTLVGELSVPVDREPVATLVTLHPLPTHGGFMDSHVIRKAANRLPAMADLAVLRFNTRGTESPRGKSDGSFSNGVHERFDVEAAMQFVSERNLPNPWLVGWSFGTELALKYGPDHPIVGAVLLSPPLRRTTKEELLRWNNQPRKLVALVPEFDDFLTPEPAREQFSVLDNIEQIDVQNGKHLWIGESQVYRVLTEIVKAVNPEALPLPKTWEGETAS